MGAETQPLLSDVFDGKANTIAANPPVKTFSAGTIAGSEYSELLGVKSHLDGLATPAGHKRVVIVGGGINGITMATTLLKNKTCALGDLILFDVQEAFGGVWEKNKYPGCGCDVPALTYTTSYFINKGAPVTATHYTHRLARREQITAYYENVAKTFNVDTITKFKCYVEECSWDDEAMIWHVYVRDGRTGAYEHWTADNVCQCVGMLDRPKYGTTPGRDKFAGETFHTSLWDPTVTLEGKRVAVIGCGPSAGQAIPEFADQCASLTIFMRTPPVCFPRYDRPYTRLHMFAMRWVPGYAWAARWHSNMTALIYGRATATHGSYWNKTLTQAAKDFLHQEIKDPALRELLTPTSPIYCKRPLRLDHFYSTLIKPHVSVLREDLIEYNEKGLVSQNKATGARTEHEFDVIIFGTGFNTAQFLEHMKITGESGVSLQEQWKSHPEALYGIGTAGFPNMFMMGGPNTSTVWMPPQVGWEMQAGLISQFIQRQVLKERQGIRFAASPKSNVQARYNREVQLAQRGYAWDQPSCITFYKNDEGHNTVMFPWSTLSFWWLTKWIRDSQWDLKERRLVDILPALAVSRQVK